MRDNRLALMTGIEIPIPECRLIAHQPTLTDIAFIGETDFFVGMQCLCISKNMVVQDESLLESTNNFQIFMTVMSEQETKDKKDATLSVLALLFPNYKIMVTPRSLIFSSNGEAITVDENNFDALQEIIKEIFCFNTGPMDQQAFNPGDAKSREIAQKLMRGRQRVAAQHAQQGDGGSAFGKYISILTIGAHVDFVSAMKLTMFQLYDLIERYYLYTNWDIDVRTRLAGGKPDSRPDDWMKSIH